MACNPQVTDNDEVTEEPWLPAVSAGIIAGADVRVGLAQIAAGLAMGAAQFLAAREQAQLIEEEHEQGRNWVIARHDHYRRMQMGADEYGPSGARIAYSQYIGSLSAIIGSLNYQDFTAYLNLADGHRSFFAGPTGATELSRKLLNDLFSKSLLSERQSNLATIDAEEQADFNLKTNEERVAVIAINDANNVLARGQEDGVINAYKREINRITKEEDKRGYLNGDCYREKHLAVSRLKDQDSIAINNETKRFENTNRIQALEQDISSRDFGLSENTRKIEHQLNENDVNQRLENIGTVGNKADEDNSVNDNREQVANNALNRRYDNKIFKQQRTPPASVMVPDSPSAAAVGALSAGNLISGAISGRTRILK
jgi:hypothetical protein